MNTQLESHPDAESLSAFAEQALAERERGQILAHLAACGRCRKVVALAQKAAPELVAAVPTAYSAIRPRSWWRNWRFAWAPAAALAAVIALAFVVHIGLERARQKTELAKVEPQAVFQGEKILSKPSVPARAEKTAPVPTAPVAAQSATSNLKPAPASTTLEQLSPEPAAPAARSSAAMAPAGAGRNVAVLPPGTSGMEAFAPGAPAQFKPQAAAWEQQPQLASDLARASRARVTVAKVMPRMSASEMQGREPATRILTSASPAPQLEAKYAPPITVEFSRPELMSVLAAPAGAKTVVLPSGLMAVSTVTARRGTLAIDGAGMLFLRDNPGSRWEHVARQWTGRAVAVRMQRALHADASAALAGGEARPEPGFNRPSVPLAPAAVFEIVNDKDAVWVSVDGRTWKAKQE